MWPGTPWATRSGCVPEAQAFLNLDSSNSAQLNISFDDANPFAARLRGGQFVVPLAPKEEYYLSYWIYFDKNFDFKKGGKKNVHDSGKSDTTSCSTGACPVSKTENSTSTA